MLCSDGLTSMVDDARDPRADRGAPRRRRRTGTGARSPRRTRAAARTTSPSSCSRSRRSTTRSSCPARSSAPAPADGAGTRTRSTASTRCRPCSPRPPAAADRSAAAAKRRRLSWRIGLVARAVLLAALVGGAVYALSRANFVGVGRQRLRRRLPGRALGPAVRHPPLPRGVHEPAARGRPLASRSGASSSTTRSAGAARPSA